MPCWRRLESTTTQATTSSWVLLAESISECAPCQLLTLEILTSFVRCLPVREARASNPTALEPNTMLLALLVFSNLKPLELGLVF